MGESLSLSVIVDIYVHAQPYCTPMCWTHQAVALGIF